MEKLSTAERATFFKDFPRWKEVEGKDAAMATFTIQCEHLCAPEGRFLAMKGVYPTDELADLAASYHVQQVHELQVPGLAAQRHLVVLTLG